MTAPAARQSDELRDQLGATFGHKPSPVHSQHGDTGRVCCGICFVDWPCATVRKIERVMVPVVTAWAEKQARTRAAGELLYAAQVVRIEHGTASTAAKIIDARADSLATGDPA